MNQPQLIQLPNGSHVRPDLVTSIRLLPPEPADQIRARVVINHGPHFEVLTVASIEEARSLAADLAARVNEVVRSLPPDSAPTRPLSIAEAIAEHRRQQKPRQP